MSAILLLLRRHVLAVSAVVAIGLVVALGVVRPGPIGAFFASPSSQHLQQAVGCDDDRGRDASSNDNARNSQGCPPCPRDVGSTGTCDADNDDDDR